MDPSGHAPQAEMDIGGPTLFASDLRNLANVETDANEKKRLLKLASARELEDKKTYNVVGSGSSRYYTPKDSGKSTNDVKQTENKEEVAKQQQEKTLDALQGTLDVVGIVPVIGSGADALNGIISFARGNYEAGIASLISIIPILGDAVGGTAKVMMKLGIYDIVKEAISLIMLHSAEIIKASKSTGQLLKTFGSLIDKMSEIISSTVKKIEEFAKKVLLNSKKSGDLFEGAAKIIHKATSGVKLVSNPSKTTTILGRYDDDMKYIINDLKINDVYVDGLSPNVGGFNVLNITKEYEYSKFWDMYNKPFIDAAVSRGDHILMATKPTLDKLFKAGSTELTGFGKEFYYLIEE